MWSDNFGLFVVVDDEYLMKMSLVVERIKVLYKVWKLNVKDIHNNNKAVVTSPPTTTPKTKSQSISHIKNNSIATSDNSELVIPL